HRTRKTPHQAPRSLPQREPLGDLRRRRAPSSPKLIGLHHRDVRENTREYARLNGSLGLTVRFVAYASVMRIVHVSDAYAPRVGGMETQVRSLAEQQARAGHEVYVLTATLGRESGGKRL